MSVFDGENVVNRSNSFLEKPSQKRTGNLVQISTTKNKKTNALQFVFSFFKCIGD